MTGVSAGARLVRTHSVIAPGGFRATGIAVGTKTSEALGSNRIGLWFNGFPVCINSIGAPGNRDVDLTGRDIEVVIDVGAGPQRATIRTTDLSHGYVDENSAYTT